MPYTVSIYFKSTQTFNTSYLTDSFIIFPLKIESVSKNIIFGLKMTELHHKITKSRKYPNFGEKLVCPTGWMDIVYFSLVDSFTAGTGHGFNHFYYCRIALLLAVLHY